MPRAVTWVLSAAFALIPLRTFAQEPLTLEQAIQDALAHNAALRAVKASQSETAERVTESRSAFYPRISANESWQRGDQPVFVFSSLLSARQFEAANFAIERLNHPDATNFFRASVGVEQLVYDGGRQKAASTVATLQRTIADSTASETGAGVVVAVTQAFGGILAAETSSRALEAALASAREDRARAERRRDVGMSTDADVLALAVHVANLEQRAIQAAGDAAIARAELNRLTGQPIARDFRAVDVPAPSTATDDLSALLSEAEAKRPEIARANAARAIADENRRQSRAAFIPQIAAQAVADFSGTEFGTRAGSWIVGGQFQWTFATGGGQLAATRAAAAATSRAAAEADDVRGQVQVQVVGAWRRLATARAREAASAAAIAAARESQRIIRDRFEAGVAGVNDVLRASSALVEAEASRTSASVDALTAAAALRRALGRTP